MNGNDYVFLFTPPYDMYINIRVTNIGTYRYTGLFLIKGCPGITGSECAAMDTSTIIRTPAINGTPVLGGADYYIVVSTKTPVIISGIPLPLPNVTTPFDIEITQSSPFDISLNRVAAPLGSCFNTSADTIKVVIKNTGILTVDTFRAGYILDGMAAVMENINARILPNDSLLYSFVTTADLSVPGMHNIKAFTRFILDNNTVNDTASYRVMHNMNISSFPYDETFENGNNGYWAAGGTNSSWACGRPNAPIINRASSDTTAWVTNLTGNFNSSENSYVYSPCFDFTYINNPVFECDIWYELALSGAPFSFTSASLEASTDGGITWVIIGATGDPVNWYNSITATGWGGSSGQWIHAKHKLDNLGGQSNVRLRIHLAATLGLPGSETEGFAFDNVRIYDGPASDMGVVAFVDPHSGCGLTLSELVTIRIKNFGSNPQTNFPVGYSLNGGPFNIETVQVIVNPGDSTNYTFTQTANLSAYGSYVFKAATCLYTDTVHHNDTSITTIIHSPTISTFPYTENFEHGSGGWSAGGINSSWALGTPNCIYIQNAASGLNCWKTNLTGNYNSGERSYVSSPCFNFSSILNPIIELSIENETVLAGNPFGFAKAVLMATTNNGITWDTIGHTGDTLNWYRGLMGGWSASSGMWLRAKHDLRQVAGQPSVIFRVYFDGGAIPFPGMETEGFAFDSIRISECPSLDARFTFNVTDYLVSLTNTSIGYTSYFWRLGDGTTSTDINPFHSYSSNGYYNVTLVAGNGCAIDSVTQVIHIDTHTGIRENHTMVSCFPNPCNGLVTFSYDASVLPEPLFRIYDVPGKEIWNEKQSETSGIISKTFDFSYLNKGVYLLNVKTKDVNSTQKIVIQ